MQELENEKIISIVKWSHDHSLKWAIICGEVRASPWKCFEIALDLMQAGFEELTIMMIGKSLNLMNDAEKEYFLQELKALRERD